MRLEMLQVARLAQRSLSDASDLVRAFVRGQIHRGGGFVDRSGDPDLYYTVFGLGCLLALDDEVPTSLMETWLSHFDGGDQLDLIHLCALARCWSALGGPGRNRAERILANIEKFRAARGGYHVSPGSDLGNPYGNFMALGAYQDLERIPHAPQALVEGCLACASGDGAFANDPQMPLGNVPAVAAAESVLRNLEAPMPPSAAPWLMARSYPAGGFFAVAGAPMPDLLSTATALHALVGMGVEIDTFKEPCLDFLDTLWVNTGAFYGNWGDTYVDTEYTFYGLLALGHLSL